MNCTETREALAADPGFNGESGHLQDCADCQAYQADLEALDQRIRVAMEITVPELVLPDLEDIDSSNVASLPVHRRMTTPAWLAVAATITLAAFIGLRGAGPEYTEYSLAEEVLAHVDHEPVALLPTSTPVDDSRLRRVVPENIASMNHDSGLITFAETCPINGNRIPHLVIQGKRGPITILLLPDEKIDNAISLDGDNVHGSILPVGNGSVAIIGSRGEQLDEVERNVMNSVAWDV